MPSPGEDIQSWSTDAAANGTIDPLIDWHEGQARASVNNSARSMLAAHAKNRNLLNGSIVTTGSINAQQFLSGVNYTTLPTNLIVRLKIGSGLTNDAGATLNMDGLGDTVIKTADGLDLKGGELVGDGYTDLLYNGTNWIFLYSREFFFDLMTNGGGIILGTQIFTTPGTSTYTPTPGTECCIIECLGGGGGGAVANGSAGMTFGGGGGGSGGYSRKTATAAAIGLSQVVTVGAGGSGGGQGDTGGSNGNPGGTTSLGSLCAAGGGGGGTWGSISSIGQGGAGGAVGTGDAAWPGNAGGTGIYSGNNVSKGGITGNGAGSVFGGGTPTSAPIGASPGVSAAANTGAGGSGSIADSTSSAAIGGNGGAGCVIITELGGRGAPGRDGNTGPMGPPGPAGAGTGDVLRFGTPANGQLAQWIDAAHIQGVAAASMPFVAKAGDTMTGNLTVPTLTVGSSATIPTLTVSSNATISTAAITTLSASNFVVFNVMAAYGYNCRSGISGPAGSNYYNIQYSGGASILFIDTTNVGVFAFVSDYRIKKDVIDLPEMWSTVKALRPIKFTQAEFSPPSHSKSSEPLFAADNIERWGFIAHELQATLVGSAASGVKDQPDLIQSPNPFTLIAALTKALQEAMARIEALEARV